jgi:hypothetical protein
LYLKFKGRLATASQGFNVTDIVDVSLLVIKVSVFNVIISDDKKAF